MGEAIFRNFEDFNDFTTDIEDFFQIKEMKVHNIIADMKREGFLTEVDTAEFNLSTTKNTEVKND